MEFITRSELEMEWDAEDKLINHSVQVALGLSSWGDVPTVDGLQRTLDPYDCEHCMPPC